MFRLDKMIFIGFVFLAIAGGCQTVSISEYSGSSKDLNLIASLKSDAEKYSSDRSILWVERGYLSKEEANLLQQKIDKAIAEIENLLGMHFDKTAYKKDKIEYFVHSRREASHTITTYHPRKYMFPVVFLSFAAEKRAPYVHETVHIIAWDWNTLWLKEGLAVFLNDKLGGYPAFPNFGADIDELATSKLTHKYPLRLIGQNGVPKFSSRLERELFYVFSGSFVKYLFQHIGIDTLMKIYMSGDTQKAVVEKTGKSLDMWKKDWIDSLRAKKGTHYRESAGEIRFAVLKTRGQIRFDCWLECSQNEQVFFVQEGGQFHLL